MQGGFSFCEMDISELGLEYVPELTRTYVYTPGEYKVYDQRVDGHDGGYYFGASLVPKTFTQRCIFESNHINDGILTRIDRFFRRGRTGSLTFAKRPWLSYIATVTKLDLSQITNYQNGFVTITLTAYYPFASYPDLYLDETHLHAANIKSNSGLLSQGMTPSTEIIAEGSEMTEQTEFLLYNGGTENALVEIRIAGDAAEGVTIANANTQQKAAFISLSKAITTEQNRYISSSALTGLTTQTDGTSSELAYLYHNYGFISLLPGDPMRDVAVACEAGSTSITQETPQFWMNAPVGQYIYVQGKWREIVAAPDVLHQTVLPACETSANESATIARMNKIVVIPVGPMALTKLDFDYKPTFA